LNNAGVISAHTETADISADERKRVMAVNVRGVWSFMKYEPRQMLRQGGGAIVNCSSIGGLTDTAGLAAYIASKHEVIGLPKTAALEYATKGIRVNVVCPGMINTPMAEWLIGGDAKVLAEMLRDEPVGRLGEPEEIAAAVLWLCTSALLGCALRRRLKQGSTAHRPIGYARSSGMEKMSDERPGGG
jgi:NAD(P)-dependent dehydrogenase (short-subunit alcohol dehydrogenase family)